MFKGKKKDLAASGISGSAVILREQRHDFGGDDYEPGILEQRFGSHDFTFELEVTLDDGRQPYAVTDRFKTPRKLGDYAGPGVTLPVFVDPDDPKRVDVDWDRFAAEGGAQAFADAYQRKREAKVREATAVADADAARQLDADVAAGKISQAKADEQKRITAMASAGELDDEPPPNASPREELDWQLAKGILDQATYDAILANNPDLK